MEENVLSNPFDVFTGSQETYEEALKKSNDENQSFSRIKHFRMDGPGTYSVRILPIAPTQQANGSWKLDRKGYEYPIKTLVLRLENPNAEGKKDKVSFVNVCQAEYAGFSTDLIDTYVKVAQGKYSEDEELVKKITNNSFEGGLKWNAQRCMFVFDQSKRADGIQLLSLSYSQYKELEERKLGLWKKLLDKNPQCPCPISSVNGAYPIEIIRKEEKRKISYTFNIDMIGGPDALSQEETQALLDAPRLPEVIYRYSRFHLEATIEFLKQYDSKLDIDVMGEKEVLDAIERIKLELPADDKSHFSFDRKDRKGGQKSEGEDDLDNLWNRWEQLNEKGIGDKTEEGQFLRDDIRVFIDNNELNVRVLRSKTNEDLLKEIEEVLEADTQSAPSDMEEDASDNSEATKNSQEDERTDDKDDLERDRPRAARPERVRERR